MSAAEQRTATTEQPEESWEALLARLDAELPKDREARVQAIMGSFAWVQGTTDDFLREKQQERRREDALVGR